MKVILHIGLHKTGTTSIQTFMHANSAYLRSKGVIYPQLGEGEYNHHTIACGLRDSLSFETTSNLIKEHLAAAQAVGMNTCVYSSEVFAEHEIPIELLPEIFKGHNLSVLAYLRRPDHQWASAYAQLVQEQEVRRQQRIDEDPLPYDCGYSTIFMKWIAVFKPEQFVLAPFDPPQWRGGCLLQDFLSMIGFNATEEEFRLLAKIHQNRAIPASLLEVLRLSNVQCTLSIEEHNKLVAALKQLADAFPTAFGSSARLPTAQLKLEAFSMLAPHLASYRPYFRPHFDEGYLHPTIEDA